jgi:hypothetical protein
MNNPEFLDFKGNPVHPGDFVMYPVNTFLRFAVVCKVRIFPALSVNYIRLNNPFAFNRKYLIENPLRHGPEPEDNWFQEKAFRIGRQNITPFDRDIVKISDQEMLEYCGKEYFMVIKELSNKIKKEAQG